MLPPLFARPPADHAEQRFIRKLANARRAPASWLQRARIIAASWDGAKVAQIAAQLGCHPKTVYRWLHRFNTGGIDALGDLSRSGRPRRLGELERGQIIALARSQPPGRLLRAPEGKLRAGPAQGRSRAGASTYRSFSNPMAVQSGVHPHALQADTMDWAKPARWLPGLAGRLIGSKPHGTGLARAPWPCQARPIHFPQWSLEL